MSLLQIVFVLAMGMTLLLFAAGHYRLLAIVGVGLAFRSFLALIDHNSYWLPWSGADSVTFYAKLVEWKRSPWLDALLSPPLSTSSMYPWLLSWFARLFGEGYLFAVFLNVLLGTFNIIQMHRFALQVLDRRYARSAAWVACLFPVSAVLSAVLIRETLIATFLLASLTHFVRSIKFRRSYELAMTGLYVFLAAVFHGALILCLAIFPLGYAIATIVSQRFQGRRLASPFRVVTTSIFILAVAFAAGPRLSKIGGAEELMDRLEAREKLEGKRTVARNSDYPVFLSRSIFRPDIALLRYCYFMFAPFPWMWRGPLDIFGAALGAFNLFGFYMAWRYRKRLDVITLTLFFCVILTTGMFSAGVNNVGTAIRHRNKIMPAFFCASLATIMIARRGRPRPFPQPSRYDYMAPVS